MSGCSLARQDPIVKKYVGALYVVAQRLHSEKIVCDEMLAIHKLISDLVLSASFFNKVSRLQDLGRRFSTVLIEQMHLSRVTSNFIRLLSQNHRLHLLPDMCMAYTSYIEQKAGKKTVYVSYAGHFGKQEEGLLLKDLQSVLGKEIELVVEEEPSLINGIRLQHKSNILDYSLRSKLDRLRKAIRGENYGV